MKNAHSQFLNIRSGFFAFAFFVVWAVASATTGLAWLEAGNKSMQDMQVFGLIMMASLVFGLGASLSLWHNDEKPNTGH